MSKKYEFQVLVTEEDGPATLLDRVTVTADSYPAAVYLLSGLFVPESESVTHLVPATFHERDMLRCCGRDVHDVPGSDHITNRDEQVTCGGAS